MTNIDYFVKAFSAALDANSKPEQRDIEIFSVNELKEMLKDSAKALQESEE